METTSTNSKSLTQFLQELISLHTSRKDALANSSDGAAEQSTRFIEELMNELSLSGDAVSSEVDHSADDINAADQTSDEQNGNIEAALKQTYHHALESNTLPPSVVTLLNKQLTELNIK